jgi:hypothetical protein
MQPKYASILDCIQLVLFIFRSEYNKFEERFRGKTAGPIRYLQENMAKIVLKQGIIA